MSGEHLSPVLKDNPLGSMCQLVGSSDNTPVEVINIHQKNHRPQAGSRLIRLDSPGLVDPGKGMLHLYALKQFLINL